MRQPQNALTSHHHLTSQIDLVLHFLTASRYNRAVLPAKAAILSHRLDAFRGIGPERALQLSRLNLHTVLDLFYHRPRRYEDRSKISSLKELELNQPATLRGTIVALGVKKFRYGRKSVFEMIVEVDTRRIHARWWNMPYMENYFRTGQELFLHGTPVSLRPPTLDHPETELVEEGIDSYIHLGRVVPIYPLTDGLQQRWLRNFIWQKLAEYGDEIPEPWTPEVQGDLLSRGTAIRQLHFPDSLAAAEQARERLAMEELVELQTQLLIRRANFQVKSTALPCSGDNRWMKPLLQSLGFKLTNAQTQVLKQIRTDLGSPHPMRRLLQGDVGSGKTIVAGCTALMALESGYSVALMAPTEILAEQHARNFVRWFGQFPVRVQIRTAHRDSLLSGPSDLDSPTLIIGTHALLEDDVEIHRLGLVIIDEQHKFGVNQRTRLVAKGNYPHLLVMTATPIPRTLGLTLYGDLDISVLNERPPGRGTIRTYVRSHESMTKVLEFIKTRLAEGRQAYIVYPRVEADGQTGPKKVKSVKTEFEKLVPLLKPYTVGLLHGRQKAADKEQTLLSFQQGSLHVLVATSVIEVGIDVPNATVLVIENAEQFGLAQLHQLRGRVGRGSNLSFCVLIADMANPEAEERLRVLEQTDDGFAIAEADMHLRGPGNLVGHDQSGLPDFRFASLLKDGKRIPLARSMAEQLLQQHS